MTTQIEARMTTVDEQDVQTPDQIFPRHKEDNPFKFSNSTLARREKEVIQMQKDYPLVPPIWCYWLWDMNETAEPGEIKDIVDNGKWEGPSKFKNAPNGASKEGCGVYTTEEEFLEAMKKDFPEPPPKLKPKKKKLK
tara:strand:- start:4356 stop:4766 length:411 start_codon:yes stop_codon:yes gene_type:complete